MASPSRFLNRTIDDITMILPVPLTSAHSVSIDSSEGSIHYTFPHETIRARDRFFSPTEIIVISPTDTICLPRIEQCSSSSRSLFGQPLPTRSTSNRRYRVMRRVKCSSTFQTESASRRVSRKTTRLNLPNPYEDRKETEAMRDLQVNQFRIALDKNKRYIHRARW